MLVTLSAVVVTVVVAVVAAELVVDSQKNVLQFIN